MEIIFFGRKNEITVNASGLGCSKSAPVLVDLYFHDHLKSGPRFNSMVSWFRPNSSKCSCQKKLKFIVRVERRQGNKNLNSNFVKNRKMSCQKKEG